MNIFVRTFRPDFLIAVNMLETFRSMFVAAMAGRGNCYCFASRVDDLCSSYARLACPSEEKSVPSA